MPSNRFLFSFKFLIVGLMAGLIFTSSVAAASPCCPDKAASHFSLDDTQSENSREAPCSTHHSACCYSKTFLLDLAWNSELPFYAEQKLFPSHPDSIKQSPFLDKPYQPPKI